MGNVIEYGICADNVDPYGSGRIRVIFDEDHFTGLANEANAQKLLKIMDRRESLNGGNRAYIPWENSRSRKPDPYVVEPFLPKHLNIVPKIGESVKIISYDTELGSTQKEYIGPHTSTMDKLPFDDYTSGRRFTKDSISQPIKNNLRSDGYFMNYGDIGLSGRDNSDMILPERSVILRSGHQDQDNQTKAGEHSLLQLQTFLNKKKLVEKNKVSDLTPTVIINHLVEYELLNTQEYIVLNLLIYPTDTLLNNKNYDSRFQYELEKNDAIIELSVSGRTVNDLVRFTIGFLNNLDNNTINLNFEYPQVYENVRYVLNDYRTAVNGVVVNGTQSIHLGIYAFRINPKTPLTNITDLSFIEKVPNDIRPVTRIPRPVRTTEITKTLETADNTGENIGLMLSDKLFLLSWLNDRTLLDRIGKYGFSQEEIHNHIQSTTHPTVRGDILVNVLVTIIDILLEHGHSKTGPNTISEDAKTRLQDLREELSTEVNENLDGGPEIINPKIRIN